MALQGSCLCGGVRFELTGEFEPGSFCHCASCKRISGGVGTANGWAPTDSINVVEGGGLRPDVGRSKAAHMMPSAASSSQPNETALRS